MSEAAESNANDDPGLGGGEERLAREDGAHRRIVEDTLRAREQLVSQTRLATLGQISASIAHDLANPLRIAHNAARCLKRYLPADVPRARHYHTLLEEKIVLVNRRIQDFIELARGHEAAKRPVDLVGVVRAVFDEVQRDAGVRCEAHWEQEPFIVDADPIQLRQVIEHLVANSVEAMAGPGQIWLEARHDAGEDEIVVRDDGPGIREDLAERIFEPLVTSRPMGTGLGLAICRQIVEHHGGTIELLPGGAPGAAFRIRLPAADLRPGETN